MKILIDITPDLNKWFPTEEKFVKGFEGELEHNMWKGDIGGDINSCKIVTVSHETDKEIVLTK